MTGDITEEISDLRILAIDDTDSRENGMCTTYAGSMIAEQLRESYTVHDLLLIRFNPGAKFKTRGNAGVGIITDAPERVLYSTARDFIERNAKVSEDITNPAFVIAPVSLAKELSTFSKSAMKNILSISDAEKIIEKHNLSSYYLGNGRGRIGCVGVIGSLDYVKDWTYECIAYRRENNRGTERQVDIDSVFELSNMFYPQVWDTVDRETGTPICIPHTNGPILYGIRGDSREAVETVANNIQTDEPIIQYETFKTNQGTDLHVNDVNRIDKFQENRTYEIDGIVFTEPKTIEGGHVFFTLKDQYNNTTECVAFEPTKHFRDIIRKLRKNDEVTVIGEYSDNTIKIEKIRINSLYTIDTVNPTCPDCNNSMKSAGRNKGYRCRECSNHRQEKEQIQIERDINTGWWEVPPCARRHISKPLVRTREDINTNRFE